MSKIKVSADNFLSIMQQIMNDSDINPTITDKSAPKEWQGKTVQEALNVEYYTFRHRPYDTELLVSELMKQGQSVNDLYALTRSFCILSISSIERVFSAKNDIVTVSANLEYWLQSDKVKLLEDMFEDIAVETNGIRIPVQIGQEHRHAVIALGNLTVTEVQETSEYGEMAVCDIDIDIIFHPESTSRANYTVEFLLVENSQERWVELPFSGLSISNTMTQKAVPKANQVRSVGSINLSKVRTFTFAFDGYKNDFISYLTNRTLESDLSSTSSQTDNNQSLVLRITRNNNQYLYDCVVKEHIIDVREDTGNEVHSLTLTTRGLKNGTT